MEEELAKQEELKMEDNPFNLEVGMVIKNAKELGKVLKKEFNDKKKLETDTRNSWQKELSFYCAWHKEGHKYIIDKIYNNKGKQKHRERDSKYYTNIETILLYVLQSQKGRSIKCSVGKTLEIVSMINKNYRLAKVNMLEASSALKVRKRTLSYIYQMYNGEIRNILERALKKMDNRCLITFQLENYMVCEEIEIDRWINEDGEEEIETYDCHRLATEEERIMISNAYTDALKEMGLNEKKDAFLKGRWGEFNRLANKKMYEKAKIKYRYVGYLITLSEKGFDREIQKLDYLYSQNQLNKDIIEKVIQSMEKKIEAKKEDWFDYKLKTEIEKIVDSLFYLNTTLDLKNEIANLSETYVWINEEEEPDVYEYLTKGTIDGIKVD